MPIVPTTREVVPGALVNIVLKADQPTGCTVQGTVSQLLTRGNHPRGIKVRLTDGRVGRVQSMVNEMAPAGLQARSDGNIQAVVSMGPTDARTDQAQPLSTQAIGLDAYIKPTKKRGKGRNTGNATANAAADGGGVSGSSANAAEPLPGLKESTCPVCGDFRGDTAALTHHVQLHFDD